MCKAVVLEEAGVFGRFIPDFGRVVAQMQYDMYHVYTVDEHTLFAIGILHKIENSLRVMLSYTIPPEAPGKTATCVHAGIVELCSPHTLLVNRHGRRFADETFFQGIVPHLRLFDPARHEYCNLPAYLIFDAQYL